MHYPGRGQTRCAVAGGWLFVVAAVGYLPAGSWAQYEPPADYYATVTGNPATLKGELHLIISDNYWTSLTGPGGTFAPNGSGHQIRSYDAAKYALPIVDRDPNNTGNVILAYNGASVQGPWSYGGTIWNREHRWPKSWGLGTSGADYSDMHQLMPCNPSINSSRNNYPYGTVSSSGGYGRSGSYWYPGDSDVPSNPDFGDDTGDSARVLFYMAVRYDGGESSTVDLEVRNGSSGQVGSIYYGGDLASALKWHYRDVPSEHERRRNHNVFSQPDNPSYYQGNRNPFADRPEYVWALFGDGANDSQLFVGGSPAGDGSSTTTVDFGTVTLGAPLPAPVTVTLNKGGTDPTYYQVVVSGDAECDLEGRYNAFETGTGSAVLTVSLPAGTTATPGLKTGTITIDNLDLTDAGTGTGSLDGDDTILVSILVAGCGNPVFDADLDTDVDQSDFARMQLCLTDVDDPHGIFDDTLCGCYDADDDNDVDLDDVAAFEACASGDGVAANPTCDD